MPQSSTIKSSAIKPDKDLSLVEPVNSAVDQVIEPIKAGIWAMIRARREALAWMRAIEINSPQSYWTYLRRYPRGMYAYDAERRLRRLGAPFAPPPVAR